jgi:hypothetical protein
MVTLTVRDGQRVDLTAEQIKKMTWPQHAKVWKVCAPGWARMGPLLVASAR